MSKGKANSTYIKILFGLSTILVAWIMIHSVISGICFFILQSVVGIIYYYDIISILKQSKKWKAFQFWLKIRSIKKNAKSINHAQVMLAKVIMNVPIDVKEGEVESFSNAAKHIRKMGIYPFMNIVKDTRKTKVTVEGKSVNCSSSYSYLDLGRDERVQNAAIEAAKAYSTGNHGPRMLCGNLEILELLEEQLSKFYAKEASLVFSSGFLACMSVIAGIARKDDLLVMDKLCHSSLKTGAKLCSAKIVQFKHNDFNEAERLIKKNKTKGKIIMIIEGVYSMDGDIGNLPVARKICDKYNATLILDEAHSLGTIGKTGRGAEEHFNFVARADIICGSFTKSLASVGGYISCNRELREFYTFYATGVVFSAPLSAYHAGAAQKSLEILDSEPEIVTNLQKNALYLREKFIANNFNIGESVTCVIPVILRDSIQAMNIHRWLLNNGAFTSLVMAPACPITAPRFRITATSSMKKEDMDLIVDLFVKAREVNKENDELKDLLEMAK